jgi:hypothetical protein
MLIKTNDAMPWFHNHAIKHYKYVAVDYGMPWKLGGLPAFRMVNRFFQYKVTI